MQRPLQNRVRASFISLFVLGTSPTFAQVFEYDTGDSGVDTALEKVTNKAVEKASAETAKGLANKYGDDLLKNIANTSLKNAGKLSGGNLVTSILLSSTPTAKFDDIVPKDGSVQIIPNNIINEALDTVGINQAVLANSKSYDLRSPGGLARFNSDLRKELLQRLNGTEYIQLAYPLLAEIDAYTQLAKAQNREASDQETSKYDETEKRETQNDSRISVNDSLFDNTKASIISELSEFCRSGSRITGEAKAFSTNAAGNLIAELGHLQCQWQFTNHPFCGARACEVREYQVEGSDDRLLRTYLE